MERENSPLRFAMPHVHVTKIHMLFFHSLAIFSTQKTLYFQNAYIRKHFPSPFHPPLHFTDMEGKKRKITPVLV